jgi:hypothetical protein
VYIRTPFYPHQREHAHATCCLRSTWSTWGPADTSGRSPITGTMLYVATGTVLYVARGPADTSGRSPITGTVLYVQQGLYVVMAPEGEVMDVVTASGSPTLIACVEHILS